MAALLDASEREKVDEVLRIPGLKFPKEKRVIANKYTALLVALGAIDDKRGRAGDHSVVVRRLSLLYQAVVLTQREDATLDIFSDRFYSASVLSISDKHPEVSKNLTPESLRLVIDLYTRAFARSGWKVIKMPVKGSSGGGGEEEADQKSTEILEPIEPIGCRIELEKAVKEWMKVRGNARSGGTANKKPVTHLFRDIGFPQQKPSETVDAYLLRVQHEFRKLNRSKHADNYVLSYVSDQRRERMDAQFDEIEENKRRIAEQFDEIDGYKKRIADMQRTIDAHAEAGAAILEDHADLVHDYNQLVDTLDRVKAELLAMIQEMNEPRRPNPRAEIEQMRIVMGAQGPVVGKQEEASGKQEEAIDKQEDIMVKQEEDVMVKQEDVVMEQEEVLVKQEEVMDSVEVMDGYV